MWCLDMRDLSEGDKMVIGDRVQHFSTGSIGTVIDTVYSMGSDFQQMCVQWEDDRSSYRDSWDLSRLLCMWCLDMRDLSEGDKMVVGS